MVKLKEPNPLNFFNLRKLKVPSPHFEYITLPMRYNLEDALIRWIDDHLKGRYYVGKTLSIDSKKAMTSCIRVGFEDAKELSYFTLACPHLKY
jgi:hypothetical protein